MGHPFTQKYIVTKWMSICTTVCLYPSLWLFVSCNDGLFVVHLSTFSSITQDKKEVPGKKSSLSTYWLICRGVYIVKRGGGGEREREDRPVCRLWLNMERLGGLHSCWPQPLQIRRLKRGTWVPSRIARAQCSFKKSSCLWPCRNISSAHLDRLFTYIL